MISVKINNFWCKPSVLNSVLFYSVVQEVKDTGIQMYAHNLPIVDAKNTVYDVLAWNIVWSNFCHFHYGCSF